MPLYIHSINKLIICTFPGLQIFLYKVPAIGKGIPTSGTTMTRYTIHILFISRNTMDTTYYVVIFISGHICKFFPLAAIIFSVCRRRISTSSVITRIRSIRVIIFNMD